MPVASEVDGSEYFKAVMKHPLLVGQMKAGAILRELSTAPPPDINLSDQRMRRYHDWHYALPRLRRDLGIPFDKDDFALSVRSYEGVRKLADDEGLCRELAQGDEETRLRILERLGIVLTEEVVAKEDVLSEALLSEADKLRGLSKK